MRAELLKVYRARAKGKRRLGNEPVTTSHDVSLRALGRGLLEEPRGLADSALSRALGPDVVGETGRVGTTDTLASNVVTELPLESAAHGRAHTRAHVTRLGRGAGEDQSHLLAWSAEVVGGDLTLVEGLDSRCGGG